MATNRNIIIIEDNETFSLLVTHYLKNNLMNAKVFIENSGKKAIEGIKRLNPAIVVLDYYLEDEISAKDVMQVINEMDHSPKVILLSSITDEQEREEVMAMGIDEFIPKSNESIYDLVKIIQEKLVELEDEDGMQRVQGKLSMKPWMVWAAVLILITASIIVILTQMG